MISEITLYETEDGKQFENYEEAEKHEMKLMFGDVKNDIKWCGEKGNDCELYDAEYVVAKTQAAADWFNYCMAEQYGIDCPIGGVGKWMFNGNEYIDLDEEIKKLEDIKNEMECHFNE